MLALLTLSASLPAATMALFDTSELEKCRVLPHTLSIVSTSNTPEHYAILRESQAALSRHPVFSTLDNRRRVQIFMAHHVWAVWDFMLLVKRLQQDLTCTRFPWTPPRHPALARFINEIVLAEESDCVEGEVLSHFDLYLRAMDAFGADRAPIDGFCEALRGGEAVHDALTRFAPPAAADFVRSTLELVAADHLEEVAGAFLFGRESLIPMMFEQVLECLSVGDEANWFRLYLERHIEIDGHEHSVLAQQLLDSCTGEDPTAIRRASEAARRALEARHRLWDQTLMAAVSQNEAAE